MGEMLNLYSKIDNLRFVRNNSFGIILNGRFEQALDVTVVKVKMSEIEVNRRILWSTDMHPNIVRFFGTENRGIDDQ